MEQYKEFAYIYDRLMHDDIDYNAWCDYIENIFTSHNISPDSICELACGTGNITYGLHKRGYEILGVDISRDMIDIASRKVRNGNFVCSDMSKLTLRGKYDAFLCMIDGLNYVLFPKSVLNTFKIVKEHLSENGVFIFDISSRYKLKNIIGNETFIHSEYDVFYSWQNRYLKKHNISDMLLNFFVRDRECYRRFEERHLQRGWSIEEMKKMLKAANFCNVEVYDELSFEPPKADSERIVFVCR